MRKMKDSKLGFEVGSGLKRSQSKYSHEGTCKLYGVKEKKNKMSKDKGKSKGEKKLTYWIENLKLGFEYQAKLAVEKQLEERKKGFRGEFYRGKGEAYKKAAEDLGKILEIK